MLRNKQAILSSHKYTEFGIIKVRQKGKNVEMKKVLWVASSKEDLEDMPQSVRKEFGYGLYQAQCGDRPDIAKTLRGYGDAGVLELVKREPNSTFRAVYTVRFVDAIVVLHAFQKKSTKGIETPKKEKDLINARLKKAKEIYDDWKAEENL